MFDNVYDILNLLRQVLAHHQVFDLRALFSNNPKSPVNLREFSRRSMLPNWQSGDWPICQKLNWNSSIYCF